MVLGLVVKLGNVNGWALLDASDGKLTRGTIYVILKRIEDKGLVTSTTVKREKPGGISLRYYRPTPAGDNVYIWWKLLTAELERAAAAKLSAI